MNTTTENEKHKSIPNDKKCELSLIDLMDDIDSDSADALKTKAWKHLAEKGQVYQCMRYLTIHFYIIMTILTLNVIHPFAFGGVDWCGFAHS